MTRFVKWKAKWFKSLYLLYKDEGLIFKDKEDNRENCNPSKVWINPEDSKKLRKTYYNQLKKEYPYLKKKKLDLDVAMMMLQLEPRVDKGVSEGYILIEV